MIAVSVTECNVHVAVPPSHRISPARHRAWKLDITGLLRFASWYRKPCCRICRIHVIAVIRAIPVSGQPPIGTLPRRPVKPSRAKVAARLPSTQSSI
jgi:hypothetical protein